MTAEERRAAHLRAIAAVAQAGIELGKAEIDHHLGELSQEQWEATAKAYADADADVGRTLDALCPMQPADEPARGEPAVTYVTVRDADDELHLECRFDDGQKFAAVIVEGGFDNLAHRIADFLNAEARASPTAAPSGDGAFEHLADVFEASRRHLPAELAEDFDDAINNCQLALAHRHAPEATVAHDYEPRDCGGTCLVCGCGKVAHA